MRITQTHLFDEAAWLGWTWSDTLLLRCLDDLSQRKLRLLACAFVRSAHTPFDDENLLWYLETAEACSEGPPNAIFLEDAYLEALATDYGPLLGNALDPSIRGCRSVATTPALKQRECDIIRDVVSNPFQPVTVEPRWLRWADGTVPQLAHAIYEERVFERMPILADALEEAGCSEKTILEHCRQTDVHVRGCWLLDVLLGKT